MSSYIFNFFNPGRNIDLIVLKRAVTLISECPTINNTLSTLCLLKATPILKIPTILEEIDYNDKKIYELIYDFARLLAHNYIHNIV